MAQLNTRCLPVKEGTRLAVILTALADGIPKDVAELVPLVGLNKYHLHTQLWLLEQRGFVRSSFSRLPTKRRNHKTYTIVKTDEMEHADSVKIGSVPRKALDALPLASWVDANWLAERLGIGVNYASLIMRKLSALGFVESCHMNLPGTRHNHKHYRVIEQKVAKLTS